MKSTHIYYLLLYHVTALIIIYIVPQSECVPNVFLTATSLFIKKYIFWITLFTRFHYLKTKQILIIEYFIYQSIVTKYGVLDIVSYIIQIKEFNSSGHLFVFSYSFYLLTRSMIQNSCSARKLHIFFLVLFCVMGLRTVIYYHRKMECVISVIISCIVCFVHNEFINE